MGNQAYDTTVINPLERPLSSDINAAQSELHRDLREWLDANYSRRASLADPTRVRTDGVVGDAFRVVPGSGRVVQITPGLGYMNNSANVGSNLNGIVGVNDLSPYAPILLSQSQEITVDAAPGAGFARVDLIQVKVDRYFTDLLSRDIYNAGTGTFGSSLLNKTLSFDLYGRTERVVSPATGTLGICYKVGTQFAYTTPDDFLAATLPTVDSGYMAIAYINVPPSSATVTASHIRDVRKILLPYGGAAPNVLAYVGPDGNTTTPMIPDVAMGNVPPGMTIAVYRETTTANTWIYWVYLFAGDHAYDCLPNAWPAELRLGYGIMNSNKSHDVAVNTPFQAGYISAADQAVLADPLYAAYPIDVAIGQPYHRYSVILGGARSGGATAEVYSFPILGSIPGGGYDFGLNYFGFQLMRKL